MAGSARAATRAASGTAADPAEGRGPLAPRTGDPRGESRRPPAAYRAAPAIWLGPAAAARAAGRLPAWGAAFTVAGAAGALYVREASPSVGGANSGEFQVMAYLLGIAHPPSYPLYLLLAKVFSLLPLPGDVAWRINVLTALLGALAVALAGLLPGALLGRGSRATLAAAVTAAAVAAMPRLWTLAVEAEVFTLHLALVLGFWLVLLRWRGSAPPARDRWLWCAGVLAGLGLANHRTFLFIGAGGVAFTLLTDARAVVRPRALLGAGVALATGLTPYVYVLRGLLVPVAYFGPLDVHRLSRSEAWYVLQGNASGETGGGRVIWQLFADRDLLQRRGVWLWHHLVEQFGPAGTALALVALGGLVFLAGAQARWVATSLLGALGAAIFAMAYAKYPDGDRYLLPLEALLALGIGTAVAAATACAGCRAWRRPERVALGGLAGIALAGYWAIGAGTLAASTDFTRGGYVYFTLNNLDAVEPNAVVCSWWSSVWGWWYAQQVDGHRRDVTLVPKGPDECVRDVVPAEFGRRPVYVPALSDAVRNSAFTFFPSRDLWVAVARRAPLVEGTLLKGPDERIFLFERGRRRWVPSMAVFTARGFDWDRVQLTPDYVLRTIPEGPPLE